MEKNYKEEYFNAEEMVSDDNSMQYNKRAMSTKEFNKRKQNNRAAKASRRKNRRG